MALPFKKYKKAISFQVPDLEEGTLLVNENLLKDKCCKSYKDKKGDMCKRCPKLLKVLKKEGFKS